MTNSRWPIRPVPQVELARSHSHLLSSICIKNDPTSPVSLHSTTRAQLLHHHPHLELLGRPINHAVAPSSPRDSHTPRPLSDSNDDINPTLLLSLRQ